MPCCTETAAADVLGYAVVPGQGAVECGMDRVWYGLVWYAMYSLVWPCTALYGPALPV